MGATTGPSGRPGKPRASGDDPRNLIFTGRVRRVNPARAGMILSARATASGIEGKPRASGDDPDLFEIPNKGAQ